MGTDVEGISTTSSIILPLASFDADLLRGMMLYVDEREVCSRPTVPMARYEVMENTS